MPEGPRTLPAGLKRETWATRFGKSLRKKTVIVTVKRQTNPWLFRERLNPHQLKLTQFVGQERDIARAYVF
jgi:hypothetical protein